MSAPIISVQNLSKRYVLGAQHSKDDGLRHRMERLIRSPLSAFRRNGAAGRGREEFWAVKNVNLDIQAGEIVGIIGRNGAGKSTFLKLLSRITEPTTGKIHLRGRVGSLLEVGTGFHPELTGRENVFLNGAILGMTREEIRSKFDEIVDFSGVERFLDTPVKHYSSGMYVRLAFAVAAHLEPEILIVDEVLAVGDAEFQKKCLGKMEDVATKQGRTVLLVSHQIPVIQNLCTKCVLMQSGTIALQGDTADVVRSYLARSGPNKTSRLSERTDRKGKHDARITAIEFLDGLGKPLVQAVSGGDTIIRMSYSVKAGHQIRNCRASIVVMTDSQKFFVMGTDLVDKAALELTGDGQIDFRIPSLPLTGGTYQLSCFIAGDGVTQDWVDDAAELDVADGDFYGTGRLYHPGWQGKTVLVPHSWTHAANGAAVPHAELV